MTINSLYTSKTDKNKHLKKDATKIDEISTKTTPSWWTNASTKTRKKPVKYNAQVIENKPTTQKYKFYYPIQETPVDHSKETEKTQTMRPTSVSNLKTPGNLKWQFFLLIR